MESCVNRQHSAQRSNEAGTQLIQHGQIVKIIGNESAVFNEPVVPRANYDELEPSLTHAIM
jgi:hypothetical protein